MSALLEILERKENGKDSHIAREMEGLCIIHRIRLIEINLRWQCCLNIHIVLLIHHVCLSYYSL